jgi:hypothetical protein
VTASDAPVIREASCSCGQLTATVTGEPRNPPTICHCLACQRRTGAPFGVNARFHRDQVEIRGEATEYLRRADDDGEGRIFRFCPRCGATVLYGYENVPDAVAIPVGAFADPRFPAPRRAIYTHRRHLWVTDPDTIEVIDE